MKEGSLQCCTPFITVSTRTTEDRAHVAVDQLTTQVRRTARTRFRQNHNDKARSDNRVSRRKQTSSQESILDQAIVTEVIHTQALRDQDVEKLCHRGEMSAHSRCHMARNTETARTLHRCQKYVLDDDNRYDRDNAE